MKPLRVIIVGGSSGLGAELARQLAARGDEVAILARRADALEAVARFQPDRIRTYPHDVTHTDEAAALFEDICRDLGGLDLLIYAAGIMPQIEPNEFDTEKDQAIFRVNVEGAIAWCNLAATRFQAVGAGTLVGIGSVAGDRGRPGHPAYHASKAALATYLESLRNRLWRSGVRVITIKPGPLDTPMTQHLSMAKMPVAVAAKKIIRGLNRDGEQYLQLSHRLIFAVLRLLPSAIFRRIRR
ncbi:MAG TPA: SDR family NAD(P)-dependent oxidoreductase [Fimbriimonadaceae bacterium]|nr:SDR family NAD(P)-dependent oxidoreductase [Fimbriimonadaceae bacterium]HRJ32719.1 SDR family NAD(P)-dependent oxidoreductase [Fimbriimonadaceae bacterium]